MTLIQTWSVAVYGQNNNYVERHSIGQYERSDQWIADNLRHYVTINIQYDLLFFLVDELFTTLMIF